MILVIPFHPLLLTAADYKPPANPALVPDNCEIEQDVDRYRRRVFSRFLYLSNLVEDTNYRFQQYACRARELGLHLGTPRLLVPISGSLIGLLFEIPPLNQVQGQDNIYLFLEQVIDFLNRNKATFLTNLCEYDFLQRDAFFPYQFTDTMLAEWVKLTGTAYSSLDQVEPDAYHEPIYGVCVVCSDACVPETGKILRRCRDEETTLLIHAYAPRDDWTWEFLLRRHLWGTSERHAEHLQRLPFYGGPAEPRRERGPSHFYGGRERGDHPAEPVFGFYPDENWRPGNTPARGRSNHGPGYKDAWGAIWVNASRDDSPPRNIHWDVQLETREAQNGWRRMLESVYNRNVRWQNPNHPHVNVEVDGRITDFSSFQLT